MTPIAAVFFDVDGVLLDSLTPHLRISSDKSREYGLELSIPDAREFKALVRRGVVVSPMKSFFSAVGFSEADATRADADYQREFTAGYPTPLFEGVDAMLETLAEHGLPLGLVTSNTLPNVLGGLGPLAGFFDPACVFTQDDPRQLSKAEALEAGAEYLGLPTSAVLFVGDQPADAEAAAAAGAPFLGVTYGWGIGESDGHMPLARHPGEVTSYVLRRRASRAREGGAGG